MPQSQVAAVQNFDVGLPLAETAVLTFRAVHGGKVAIRLENAEGVAAATVSVKVSADNITYVDTSAANNLEAIVDEEIPRGEYRDYVILLRESLDLYVQVLGLGETRLQVQMRTDMNLEFVLI